MDLHEHMKCGHIMDFQSMDLQTVDLHTMDFIYVETVHNKPLFHSFIVLMRIFKPYKPQFIADAYFETQKQ